MQLYFLWLIPFIVVSYIGFLYNRIVQKKNAVKSAKGSIDIMLKRRFNLLPNLAEITKQHAITETSILHEIIQKNSSSENDVQLPARFVSSQTISLKINELLIGLIGIPELSSSKSFLNLQSAWNESEEQIAAARRFYNTAVTEYNTAIESFPANLFVDPARFRQELIPGIADQEKKVPSARELFRN